MSRTRPQRIQKDVVLGKQIQKNVGSLWGLLYISLTLLIFRKGYTFFKQLHRPEETLPQHITFISCALSLTLPA